jgi:hypothetical protein
MFPLQNEKGYLHASMRELQLSFTRIRIKKRLGDMYKICYFCLEVKPTFVDPQSGQRICNDCFGGRYKKKSDPVVLSFKDLKDFLEKNW